MKFIYSVHGLDGIDLNTRKKIFDSFPDNFQCDNGNGWALTVNIDSAMTDTVNDLRCKGESSLQREVERIFFISKSMVFIEYELKGIEYDDGTKKGINFLESAPCIAYEIEETDKIDQQNWNENDNIELQLKLWFLAMQQGLPLAAYINLLFQIIEIDHPNTSAYLVPTYGESGNLSDAEIDSKKESLFLRNLVSHGKQNVGDPHLITYCEHLGIPLEMHNPLNQAAMDAIRTRVHIVRNEAKRIIKEKVC